MHRHVDLYEFNVSLIYLARSWTASFNNTPKTFLLSSRANDNEPVPGAQSYQVATVQLQACCLHLHQHGCSIGSHPGSGSPCVDHRGQPELRHLPVPLRALWHVLPEPEFI